jgi:pimeloyl-ACP methyl ester carboxylesterase
VPCTITDYSTNIDGLAIAGFRATTSNPKHRLMAVHGWLDNANSFMPLMSLLDDIDLVAVDLPGHGQSSHLPKGAHYHFVDTPGTIFQVAEKLAWENFHWLGHSLGGCLAPFAAVERPAAISSIIMLEATGPLTEEPDKIPSRLARSNEELRNPSRFKSRLFPTIEAAVEARLRASGMNHESARLIVERQLESTPEGYRWCFDPRHRMTSPVYLTEAQVLAVLDQVECPALVVTADNGYLTDRVETTTRLEKLKHCHLHQVSGQHHMHMDNPESVASVINSFLVES